MSLNSNKQPDPEQTKVRLSFSRIILFLGMIVAGTVGVTNFSRNVHGGELLDAAALPELPRTFLNTTFVKPPGRTFNVSAGADLQAIINAAKPGDTIEIQPTAIFIGNFVLPAKPTEIPRIDEWIVIRSATPDPCLPPPGNRITPEYADLLPKIISPNGQAAIETQDGAHHYRLIGLEIGVVAQELYNNNLLKLGEGNVLQALVDVLPHDLIIDRCYIHGNPGGQVVRGIALNSARTAVIDSYVSEIHGDGFDTQAICGWNGPGPYKILNNYLEASGENVMFGGGDPFIQGLVPSDIEFRNNHLFKPLRWKRGSPEFGRAYWTVKNLLELKNAQRVLIEGNVIENNWADAQDGFALVFKSVNQDGAAPWSVTRDVTFINNIVRNSDSGLNLLGRDTSQATDFMKRVLVRNNLWENITGDNLEGSPGRFLQISDAQDVTIDHNTVLHSGLVISTYELPSPNFVYTNNLSAHNEYGVKGDGKASGNDTIQTYFPQSLFLKNVFAGGPSNFYPANNFFPSSLNDVQFVNVKNRVYQLAPTSPYVRAGLDGKDLGCDFDSLGKAISKVVINTHLSRNPLPKDFCGRISSIGRLQKNLN